MSREVGQVPRRRRDRKLSSSKRTPPALRRHLRADNREIVAEDVVAKEARTRNAVHAKHARLSDRKIGRTFCGACGSPVYSTNSGMPGVLFVRASSLDDPERFVPGMIVYASRAPSWAVLDPKLASFSEMPPAAQQPAKLH
jgi:hypothetical protein